MKRNRRRVKTPVANQRLCQLHSARAAIGFATARILIADVVTTEWSRWTRFAPGGANYCPATFVAVSNGRVARDDIGWIGRVTFLVPFDDPVTTNNWQSLTRATGAAFVPICATAAVAFLPVLVDDPVAAVGADTAVRNADVTFLTDFRAANAITAVETASIRHAG